MKRIIALTTALVLIIAVFAGCGGSDNGSGTEANTVDLSTVLASVNEAYPDEAKDSTAIDSIEDLNKYYNISADDVKQFAAEVDKKNSAFEIVLVEANDADAAGRVKTALDTRYNYLRSTGASYNAEQLKMVESCEVTTNGNFVIYIISKEYKGILDKVNSAL